MSPYELSDQQLALYQYGRFYDSINKMSPVDKPEDRIIDDDSLLDSWYRQFVTEQERQAAKLRPGKRVDIPGQSETAVTPFNPFEQHAKNSQYPDQRSSQDR